MTIDAVAVMESGGLENTANTDRHPDIVEDSRWSKFCNGPSPSLARYAYGLIFLVTNILAWAIRDYGQTALSGLKSKLFHSPHSDNH